MIHEIAQMPKVQTEYLNNTRVSNYISLPSSQSTLFSSNTELLTIPSKNIVVTLDLATDKNLSLSNPNITPYDMAVMDAIYTLIVNGTTIFTPEMVARVMTGNLDQHISPQKAGAVTKSINKLIWIQITIDCTDEMRVRKLIKHDQELKLKSFMLQLTEIDIESANHKSLMRGYHITSKPILHIYAETIHQIIAVPRELIAASSSTISDTDDVIVIKRALIRRIEQLKNTKNHMKNNFIRYERYDSKIEEMQGFFSVVGFDEDDYKNHKQWLKKKLSLHKTISTILDVFITEKYIAGYEVVKEGKQKIIGIKITL